MKKYLALFSILALILISSFVQQAMAGRYKGSNLYMLATVLWHEIRGGSDMEIKQVANVIMNRLDLYERGNKEGYQLELGDILTARAQFSGSETYLNAKMTDQDILRHIKMRGSEGVAWKRCLNIAEQALAGQLPDLVHGATHYRTCTGPNMTFWGASKIKGVAHGKHCFFKGIQMGAMRVNGHTFKQGKVTGKYNNGAFVEAGGDGTGEGSGYYGSYGGYGGGGYDNGTFIDLTYTDQEYIQACKQAKTETDGIVRTPPNLFNTNILSRMSEMLQTIYISLGKLYVIGQGLMCYASHTNRIDLKVFKMVNIPYWLAGLAIYLSAFFITLSIGLFFIDIAFKIGFALLMLPISIALWPFEPTRGKLSENFSIIIRNSMLFVLVSIGISYGITLIQSSIAYGINEDEFARSINDSSSTQIAEQFALSGTNTLIILFCLIYAYLLIQSSVNDYLNRIFPDNVFGGDSPMHLAGVQAFGNFATHVALPVASMGTDIIRNQAGLGLVKMGEGLKNISHRRGPTDAGNTPPPTTPQPTPSHYTPDTYETEQPETENAQTDNTDFQTDLNSDNTVGFNGKNNRNHTFDDESQEGQKKQNRPGNTTQTPNKPFPNETQPDNTRAENTDSKSSQTTTPQNNTPISAFDAFKLGMQNADSSTNSLSIGTILKNVSKVANAPFELLNKKTYTQLAHLDELQARQSQKNAQRRAKENALVPNMNGTQRVILRAGQLFMRTAQDTKNESAYAAGSVLSGLGQAIRPNANKKSNYWSDWWERHQEEERIEAIREREQAETGANLADQYVERE